MASKWVGTAPAAYPDQAVSHGSPRSLVAARTEENDVRDDRDNDRAPATRCAHEPGRVRSRHALPSLTFSV